MCDSIANGGPRCAPSCPPANVTIASNVLSTTGDIYASNGTFTGTLTVAGNIVGPVNLTNLYVANSVTTTNVYFQNRILSTNLPVFNTAQGTWGSSANVSQVTVDQYGRVSGASNVAITSSQWTSVAGNVAYQNGVSIGTLSAPPDGSNLLVLGTATISNINSNGSGLSSLNAANLSGPATLTNLYVANSVTTTNVSAGGTLQVTGAMTSNVANTTFYYDTFTIPYINTQVLNAASINFTAANLATLNVQSLFAGSMTGNGSQISNLNSSNLFGPIPSSLVFANTFSNIQSSAVTQPFGNLVVSNAVSTTNLTATRANIGTLNISTISNLNSLTTNLTATTANIGTLNVFQISNLNSLTTNLTATTANVGTLNVFQISNLNSLTLSSNLTTTNVFASTVSATNPIPFRNRIINGAMTVWQRTTASTSTTPGQYTTADRWCGALGTSGLILSQWPGPIEAPQFPLALQVTTSTSISGTPLVEQRMENQNVPDFLNGTPVTVSFWAGQSYGTLMPLTVGLYYGTVVNNFGTQTLAVAATQNTPTLTAANAYYSLSFTLNTSLGATNGLALRFTTGGASAIGSTFFITGVQVEKGAVATPFEVRPYATELALVQRYYYQLTSPTAAVQGSAAVYAIFGTAIGITSSAFWLPIQFPVPMRNPNYTFSNSVVTNFQLLPTGTTTITGVGVQSDSYTTVGATLNFAGTNITPTSSYIFRTNNLTGSTVAFFGFSCEL